MTTLAVGRLGSCRREELPARGSLVTHSVVVTALGLGGEERGGKEGEEEDLKLSRWVLPAGFEIPASWVMAGNDADPGEGGVSTGESKVLNGSQPPEYW